MPRKILNVVGARPNFMKIAPLMEAFAKRPGIEARLLHTGQHYDAAMSKLFFEDLGIPRPDIYLGVGSGGHGAQTGKIMIEFERVVLEEKPDLVLVVGDVNSTIACSLVAVKLGVQVAHVEAGLRSFDPGMPEEINRILTDRISEYLFVTEKSGEENLLREGIAPGKIHFVGNVMIDTLRKHLAQAEASNVLTELQLEAQDFVVLTLHRPSNVDQKGQLTGIVDALEAVQQDIKIVFPVHPRCAHRLAEFGLRPRLDALPGVVLSQPRGYLDFLKLLSAARFVLTDSGGIQEETTVLGIPCLTLRENTERPVTVTQGSNRIIGSRPDAIVAESEKILSGDHITARIPDLWDGKAAERIADILI